MTSYIRRREFTALGKRPTIDDHDDDSDKVRTVLLLRMRHRIDRRRSLHGYCPNAGRQVAGVELPRSMLQGSLDRSARSTRLF